MNNAWGRLPIALRSRPFDVFIAVILGLAGVYQILDPTFPESQQNILPGFVLLMISIYMIAASLAIIVFMFHKCRNVFFQWYGQMYGWMFMNAATLAITIFDAWVGLTLPIENALLFWSFFVFWILISIATFIKWFDMWNVIKAVVRR